MKKYLNIFLVSIFLLIPRFAISAPQFLDFPVSGYGPYSPGIISSVLDHDVAHDLNQAVISYSGVSTLGPFGYNGGVLSFTGELFIANAQKPASNLGCYPKVSNVN